MLKAKLDKVYSVQGAWNVDVCTFILSCSQCRRRTPCPSPWTPSFPNAYLTIFLSLPILFFCCDYKSVLYSLGKKNQKRQNREENI